MHSKGSLIWQNTKKTNKKSTEHLFKQNKREFSPKILHSGKNNKITQSFPKKKNPPEWAINDLIYFTKGFYCPAF